MNPRLLQEKTLKKHTENTMGNMDKEQGTLPHKCEVVVPIRKTADKNNIQQLENFYYEVMNNKIRDNYVGPATTKLK
jgi:hypothetical protein